VREARDRGRPYFSHANEQRVGMAVKQRQDLKFEVRLAARQARQVSNVDRRLVPGGRGQFLEEKGLIQVLQEDGSLWELAHARCPARYFGIFPNAACGTHRQEMVK
jgi:hypothetical protein